LPAHGHRLARIAAELPPARLRPRATGELPGALRAAVPRHRRKLREDESLHRYLHGSEDEAMREAIRKRPWLLIILLLGIMVTADVAVLVAAQASHGPDLLEVEKP